MIEGFPAARCPFCGEAEIDTRHARLCHRSGAQVNQHQPLVHALFRTLKSISIRHQVERGAPFHANRNFRMDIVVEAGEAVDSPTPLDYEAKMPHCRIYNTMTELTTVRGRERVSTCGILVEIGLRKHERRGH